jgi:hypothetical protein
MLDLLENSHTGALVALDGGFEALNVAQECIYLWPENHCQVLEILLD